MKTKITPPMPIKDFAADVLDFAKKEADKEALDYLKSEVKEMIETLEAWKAKEDTIAKIK